MTDSGAKTMSKSIKVRVSRKGANETVDGESRRIPVGTVLEFKDGKVPGWLRGKCEVVGEAGDSAEMVTGQGDNADLEELRNEYELLAGKPAGNMKPETLRKKIDELKSGNGE